MAASIPTYHWREILAEEPYVTAIVRGEGEETARQLMAALRGAAAVAGDQRYRLSRRRQGRRRRGPPA